MAILPNIIVSENDLLQIRPDLNRYYQFENQESLDDVIASARRVIYREIKAHEKALFPEYDESQLETRLQNVRDFSDEQALHDKIVLLTIAEIMLSNDLVEVAQTYINRARQLPLHYWVDLDQDQAISSSETRRRSGVIFGR